MINGGGKKAIKGVTIRGMKIERGEFLESESHLDRSGGGKEDQLGV